MAFTGYLVVFSLLMIGFVWCETNSSIPLGFLRREGFMDDMQSRSKMMDRLMRDKEMIMENRITTVNLSVFGPGPDENFEIKKVGEQDIRTIERSDLSTSQMLSHAGCAPYDQVVDVPNPNPNVVMYPACVVVKRCGGCCGHPSLACRPVIKDKTKIMVMRYVYNGTLRPARQVTYEEIEYHQSCQCGCKIQESDCNPILHTYDDFNCQCVCKNEAQSDSCPSNKRWNSNLCACQCTEIANCGGSYIFDPEQCRCVPGFENSGSNGNNVIERSTVNPQPDNRPTETQTVSPCRHLSCPRRYITVYRNGRCTCKPERRTRG